MTELSEAKGNSANNIKLQSEVTNNSPHRECFIISLATKLSLFTIYHYTITIL